MIRHKAKQALTLVRQDGWLLCQTWVLLLLVDWGLRLWPFSRVQALLVRERRESRSDAAPGEAVAIEQALRLVGIAAQYHLYPMRCLRRALVLQWLLDRRGITTDLRIGVRRDATGLCAHAWLERDGQPIGELEGVAARFAPLVAPQVNR